MNRNEARASTGGVTTLIAKQRRDEVLVILGSRPTAAPESHDLPAVCASRQRDRVGHEKLVDRRISPRRARADRPRAPRRQNRVAPAAFSRWRPLDRAGGVEDVVCRIGANSSADQSSLQRCRPRAPLVDDESKRRAVSLGAAPFGAAAFRRDDRRLDVAGR